MNKLLLILLLSTSTIFAQNYNFLGSYTADGTPLYLEPIRDVVDVATQNMIKNSLPEGYPVPDFNPHYISSGYDTDIILDKAGDVWVTFVSEGAGYRNVLGFYTYDVNNPFQAKPQPQEITIIFPNVSAQGSGGGLLMGDKVKIGSFPAGTGIGWVLLANAWNGSSVTSGQWQLFSNINFNPESSETLRYHNVLLNDPTNERVILGFEDIRRDNASCDNDFNDAVFYVTANPYEAIRSTNYADVSSASNVTSANNGGLESNGNLAGLIAKRNFNRKTSGSISDKKNFQKTYAKGSDSKGKIASSIEQYLPETGMYGTETAYISSPKDLIGITNAKEIFSIDYYQNDKRVSAVLATKTEASIYDHSKVICDRLNSSSLEDVRTVLVRGHQIISSKIKRATGETEYTLSFSVKLGVSENELFSFWNIAQYPEGDYYNFQIWGSSLSQVFSIGNYIIDTITTEKPLTSAVIKNIIPSVFVSSGTYNNGEVTIKIINKSNSKSILFDGNVAMTEVSQHSNFKETISLSGNWNDTVTIQTGTLFDIGFSITTPESVQPDALYLADGPWGVDYPESLATIDVFYVNNRAISYSDSLYEVERQPSISGLVKGNVNLFRHLLPGDQTLDVTEFNSIQFNIQNNQPIEIIMMPENLTDWNNRLRYIIPSNSGDEFYKISFDDFVDANGNKGTITDIKTVVFSVIGDYVNYVPFSIDITNLAFVNTTTTLAVNNRIKEIAKIRNYPNPFKTSTTIKLDRVSNYVDILVYDMLGRTVDSQHLTTGDNKAVYTAPNLSKGIYKYILVDDSNQTNTGTFLID